MAETKTISPYRQSLREHILDTAMHAFAKQGVRAVKMDDIAQTLGISKRTLYELYENKEVLLFEGIRKYKSLREQEYEQLLQESDNVMELVVRVYRAKMEEFRQTSPHFYADIVKYPRVVEYLQKDHDKAQQRLREFLQRGIREGFFRKDIDIEITLLLFDAFSKQAVEQRLFEQFSLESIFLSGAMVMLRGLCTRRGLDVLSV